MTRWQICMLVWLFMSTSAARQRLSRPLGSILGHVYNSLRYKSFREYREVTQERLAQSFDTFLKRQAASAVEAQHKLDELTNTLGSLYTEATRIKLRQEMDLNELTKQSIIRPRRLDESLEQFRRAYNESVEALLHPPTRARASSSSRSRSSSRSSGQEFGMRLPAFKQKSQTAGNDKSQSQPRTLTIDEPFAAQMESLRHDLTKSWDALLTLTKAHTSTLKQDVTARVTSAEEAVHTSLHDLSEIQSKLLGNAKILLSATNNTISVIREGQATSKRDLLKQSRVLEAKFHELEREGKQWVEIRLHQVEGNIKLVQEKMALSNSAYEELITKRKASLYYTALNDAILNQVLKLMDLSRPGHGWKLIREEDGYTVYRKQLHGPAASAYACVMCTGVINAPPQAVFSLFEDNTRVPEYNSFYDTGTDLELVAPNTKITHITTPPVFPFKPRDFVTVVHMRKLKDGTYVVVNKAATHPDAPPKAGYVRGQIILGANIIQPVAGNARKTRLTMLTQLDPGGFAPPVAINHICTLGPVGFMKNIEAAARKPPSRKVLQEKKQQHVGKMNVT